MFGRAKNAAARKDHSDCSGCSLCLLVCPAWRKSHDPRMTPEGRAKALQHGTAVADLEESLASCTLCGACEPVCPEGIDLVGMTLALRGQLAQLAAPGESPRPINGRMAFATTARAPGNVFLAGSALRDRPDALAQVARLLDCVPCEDEGADIALSLEAGAPVPQSRLDRFVDPLRQARTIIVDDGLWMRHLRAWLPKSRLIGLGEALSSLDSVRRGLRKSDLYVIEPRSYHGDYERLVKHYDRLRAERGCAFNLDLQRIAIPAAGQADWILKGRSVERIVVERLEDAAAFELHGACPVVHVAELADH